MVSQITFILANNNFGGVQKGMLELFKYLKNKRHFKLLIIVKKKNGINFNSTNHSYANYSRVIKSSLFLLRHFRNLKKNSIIISGQPYLNILIIFINLLLLKRHRVYVTEHNPTYKTEGLINFLLNKIKFFFYYFSCGIFCVSKALKNELNTKLIIKKIPKKVVYNAIDINKFCLKKIKKYKPKLHKIVYFGRFAYQKNLTFLIESLSILKSYNVNFTCYLIGEGPEKDKIIKSVQKYNLANIVIFKKFNHFIENDINKFDIFVLPSRYEGFSISLVEAMLTGLQVVSTRTEGPSEIINNKYGYLSDLNPESFAKEILNSINNPLDPEILRKRALSFCRPSQVINKYNHLINYTK